MPTTTLPQQLTEISCALVTRQRVYPEWVRTQRLTQATADHRTHTLTDTIESLVQFAALLLGPSLPSTTQGQLFAPGQAAQKTTPYPYAEH